MSANYPLEFTLEDGTHVLVHKTGNYTFDFTLTPNETPAHHFTFVDDDRSKDEKTGTLNFDQLNAVRMFWLKTHDVI